MKEFFSNFKNSLTAKVCMFTLALLFVGAGTLFAQPTVRGTVTDDAGNPLVGVTIVVPGSTNGTTTDVKGNYTINVPQGGTIEFSYLGMASHKAVCGGGDFETRRSTERGCGQTR